MLKLNYEKISDKANFWSSVIANIITICVPIVAYFKANDIVLYIISFLLLLTVARNIYEGCKLSKIKTELLKFHEEKEKQSELISKKQDTIINLMKENESYKKKLQRIHDDLIAGKVSSDILINYYISDVDSQYVKYIKMEIDAHIIYIMDSKLYDVKYVWSIEGQNPSQENVLSKLSFIISGDSVVKNNAELGLKVELKKSNGDWKEVMGVISGSDKIKYLHINLDDYAVLPNYPFNIRFSYIWPRSYVADGGDIFSFGSNTFSSTEPYDLFVKVHGNKKCFSSARQQIRNVLDSNNIKNQFSELNIIEKDDENIVTALLPASEKDRAIYISLAQ